MTLWPWDIWDGSFLPKPKILNNFSVTMYGTRVVKNIYVSHYFVDRSVLWLLVDIKKLSGQNFI